MTEIHLVKLKTQLPKAAVTSIAEKLNLTTSHVRKVLNGKRDNTLVIDEAINLAEETTLHNLQRAERIEALATNKLS